MGAAASAMYQTEQPDNRASAMYQTEQPDNREAFPELFVSSNEHQKTTTCLTNDKRKPVPDIGNFF